MNSSGSEDPMCQAHLVCLTHFTSYSAEKTIYADIAIQIGFFAIIKWS